MDKNQIRLSRKGWRQKYETIRNNGDVKILFPAEMESFRLTLLPACTRPIVFAWLIETYALDCASSACCQTRRRSTHQGGGLYLISGSERFTNSACKMLGRAPN